MTNTHELDNWLQGTSRARRHLAHDARFSQMDLTQEDGLQFIFGALEG
jgi:hypothetical protein